MAGITLDKLTKVYDDGTEAVHRHADRRAHDSSLRQGSVEAAISTKLSCEAVGNSKDAPEGSHILAEHKDVRVLT